MAASPRQNFRMVPSRVTELPGELRGALRPSLLGLTPEGKQAMLVGRGGDADQHETKLQCHAARSLGFSMSFDLVLFGGTGDLAWRKLMPALFQAFRHGTLPPGGRIIGIARDALSDEQYRELIRSRFDHVDLAKRPTPEEFARFAGLLHYLRLDLSQPQDYGRLAALLRERNADTVVM